MPEPSWKRFEREVASFFNTIRLPLSGRWSRHGTESDSLHKALYIEAKRDKKYLGKTFMALVADTFKCAKQEGKIPVLAFKDHGKKGFYVFMHSDHFQAIVDEQVRAATEPPDGE